MIATVAPSLLATACPDDNGTDTAFDKHLAGCGQ
jgi:hypothetical protein